MAALVAAFGCAVWVLRVLHSLMLPQLSMADSDSASGIRLRIIYYVGPVRPTRAPLPAAPARFAVHRWVVRGGHSMHMRQAARASVHAKCAHGGVRTCMCTSRHGTFQRRACICTAKADSGAVPGDVATRRQALYCVESAVLLARTEWPHWNDAIPYDALQAGLLYVCLVMFCCLAGWGGDESGSANDAEDLRKSIVILQKSVNSRDHLISITSHELKTPLHGIIGARSGSHPLRLRLVASSRPNVESSPRGRHEGRRTEFHGGIGRACVHRRLC
jgi:hypothetical protein